MKVDVLVVLKTIYNINMKDYYNTQKNFLKKKPKKKK